MPGPVPKRDDERIRRQSPDYDADKLEVEGAVIVPPLNMPFDPHPMVQDFYDSLVLSGQSKFYEPSDWEYARLVCFIMQTIVTSPRPSSEMFKALQTAMSNLMVTEGDRRRLRLEIVRAEKKEKADDESQALIMEFRKRMTEAVESRSSA
jgi:hypothetical protein